MARITRAKPLKNSSPCSASLTSSSSSNDAPAQNGPVPSLRNTMTRAAASFPSQSIASAIRWRSAPGRELPLGWQKVTVPMPSEIVMETSPPATVVPGTFDLVSMRTRYTHSSVRRLSESFLAVYILTSGDNHGTPAERLRSSLP